MPEPTLVDIIEDVVDECVDQSLELINMGRKMHGTRPAFTEAMPPLMKVSIWSTAEKAGPQGWADFCQARVQEGMTMNTAIRTMLELNDWVQGYLKEHPDTLEKLENGIVA